LGRPPLLIPRAKSAPSQSSVFKREAMKSHLLSALMCLVLLAGAAFVATPATELLYVQEDQNLVTYSVNKTTGVTKKLGTLGTAGTTYKGATKITMSLPRTERLGHTFVRRR
jgi:hypothetical protein